MAELARAGAAAGLRSASVSIDGKRGDARPAAWGRGGAPVGTGGRPSPEGGGRRPRGQHANQPTVDARAARRAGDADRSRRARLADPAHRRDGPSGRRARPAATARGSPGALSAAGETEGALRRSRGRALAGEQRRLLRSVRINPEGRDAARPHGLVRSGLHDARYRGQRRHQRLPIAADRPLDRGQYPRRQPARHLGTVRAAALHARPHRRISGATAVPVITPISAAPVAPGPGSACSASRATTPCVTTERWRCGSRESGSAWSASRRLPACPSITGTSKSSSRTQIHERPSSLSGLPASRGSGGDDLSLLSDDAVTKRLCAGGCSGPIPARLVRAALVAAAAGALGAACQNRSIEPPYGGVPLFDAATQSTHDAGEPTDGSPDSKKDGGK